MNLCDYFVSCNGNFTAHIGDLYITIYGSDLHQQDYTVDIHICASELPRHKCRGF